MRLRFVCIPILILAMQGCELIGIGHRSHCLSDQPKNFGAVALITLNHENQTVPVTIYEGAMEVNSFRHEKELNKYIRELWLEINKQYTVVAFYKKDGKTYQVVSGVNMTVSHSNKCYYVNNAVVDLRLKE